MLHLFALFIISLDFYNHCPYFTDEEIRLRGVEKLAPNSASVIKPVSPELYTLLFIVKKIISISNVGVANGTEALYLSKFISTSPFISVYQFLQLSKLLIRLVRNTL